MQSINGVKYKFGRGTPINALPVLSKPVPSFAADAGALFNFTNFNTNNRPTNSVSVENIPHHINKREMLALFSTLIGEIRSYQEIKEDTSARLDITFFDRDSAAKALCMNGYTVGGAQLSVSTLNPSPNNRGNKQVTDDRRNLYVLGLPFAFSKNEFASLFSNYGTISHCVILATVDNSSRRRGFVVMSSHEEARRAMTALTRTQIKGHAIDVSWAVVQRSQGFLDGGDRAMLLDSRSRMPSPGPIHVDRQRLPTSGSSDSSLESQDSDPASLTTSFVPTTSLLVTNIPTILFSQAQDLQPLFFPFGQIEKLEIVQVSPLGTMSVLVQYSSASMAQEAKESLSGQLYGSYQIDARYVRSNISGLLDLGNTSPTCGLSLADKNTYPYGGSSSNVSSSRNTPDHNVASYNVLHAKASSLSDYLGFTNMESARYGSCSDLHSRQSFLSAKNPTFSDVFNDFNDFPTRSNSSSYAHVPDHHHHQYSSAFLKQMHFNTVYQGSTA